MNKFLSRKFILSALTMVITIAGALSGIGGNVGTISCIVGTIATCVVYNITEGVIDAKAIRKTSETIIDAIDELKKIK